MSQGRHRVVIVGGGFGGVRAARALARTDVGITIVDRTNHHLFQPLLYQVATGILPDGLIAPALRSVVRKQANARVVLADVQHLDLDGRVVHALAPDGQKLMLSYDSLVVAAGCTDAYFGHDEWAVVAPGLKTLEDAGHLRSHILGAFEMAELATDPAERAAYLTFAVIGAGPTGVEVAGQIAELAHETLPREYKSVATTEAKILLIEAGPQVLTAFAPKLQRYTQRRLQKMGVEVRLNDLPGVAQPAIQEGTYVGRLIHARLAGKTGTTPFAYRDKGSMATIGHLSAVTDAFGMQFTGVIGYTMWGFVHVLYLVGWGNRVGAMFNWARALTFSKNRPHRTITYEHAQDELAEHHYQRE
jgi:NADH dehydrogenase FAD-containing subunit